jgi:hypothetical protein
MQRLLIDAVGKPKMKLKPEVRGCVLLQPLTAVQNVVIFELFCTYAGL